MLRVAAKDLQKALQGILRPGSRPSPEREEPAISGKNPSAAVSQNRKTLILDEGQILGAVRREDADEAAKEFLSWLKAAWEAGDLRLDGDEDLVV